MREFTKSILSFSWAMSLFGVQQVANVLKPGKATSSFKKVTEAATEEFGDTTEATFKAGDNLQRGLVDLTFGIFSLQAFNPSRWAKATSDVVQQAAKATSDVAQQAVGAVEQVIPGAEKDRKS